MKKRKIAYIIGAIFFSLIIGLILYFQYRKKDVTEYKEFIIAKVSNKGNKYIELAFPKGETLGNIKKKFKISNYETLVDGKYTLDSKMIYENINIKIREG